MNAEKLVAMANQISRFFEAQPVREEGVAGVLDHIERFWDPRMRAALLAHHERGGEGLRAVAQAAVSRLAAASARREPR
jgi:formate dehydrogenase subunit delta